MSSTLRSFLKRENQESPNQGQSTDQSVEPSHELTVVTRLDGKKVTREFLRKDEKEEGQRRYTLYTGRGFRQRVIAYHPRSVYGSKYQLSTYVVPDFLRPPKLEDDGLNEKQKEYKANVLTSEDLRKLSPKKTKSKNDQGLDRYILWNELKANKNGFLYYSIPLLINIVFLLFNAFKYDFWANIIFSIVALTDILLARAIWKAEQTVLVKVLLYILLLSANVGLYFLGKLLPELYGLIDIPYSIKLFLISFCIYYFGKFYAVFAICYAQDCSQDFGNTVQINAGKPRCGKTTIAVSDVFVLAKQKWEELKYDYWVWISREDEIIKKGDKNELLELQEIKLAYNFYANTPNCIPCLWSNIPIFDKKGRACHQVTLEHIKGLERMPVYSVVMLDEVGAMLKADDGLNKSGQEKPVDVSDMFRLGGHFVKWVVICCEQDFHHIFIDVRRVVGFNRVIHGQEWVCKPVIAYAIFKFLKMFKTDDLEKSVKKSPIYAKFLKKFEKFVRSIGFRRIKYSYTSNTETSAGMTQSNAESTFQNMGGVKSRWVPSTLICDYDDRAYKQKYPSYFDKSIRGELFKAKCIDGLDSRTEQYVNSTAALVEKRDAIESSIKKIA